MNEAKWTEVDAYLADLFVGSDSALEHAARTSETAGLPAISVTPNQGKLLYLLAQLQGAKKILEIGTLGGYSTIWLARALPAGGRVVTLELEPAHAEVARGNFAFAKLTGRIDLWLGQAIETLPQLAMEGVGPFDMVFIDADKESTAEYYEWAVRMSRPGTLILVDNIVREGAVIDGESSDTRVQGVRRFNEKLSADPRVVATVIQTVGSKGYDGFAVIRVI
jgi:predicted O-methyltransferase YrrM